MKEAWRRDRKVRLQAITRKFAPVLFFCVEMPFYDVMVAEVGRRGEKHHEYRAVSEHWSSRLLEPDNVDVYKEFSHVMVFGGVQVPDVDGKWFVAKWERTSTSSGPHKAGPYSNGAAKSFSTSVFVIELGKVLQSHRATRQ